ncbi:hypothetical protein VTL71DRAFT_3983 [Oculimacula yallundae]|uniref:Uncharacterized protein n=1 Tax=Oculimacula yallundae TaxID=86028 RepID=A0ABR4C4I7_9HELO
MELRTRIPRKQIRADYESTKNQAFLHQQPLNPERNEGANPSGSRRPAASERPAVDALMERKDQKFRTWADRYDDPEIAASDSIYSLCTGMDSNLAFATSSIKSVYESDPASILKGYETWHNGRCVSRIVPDEYSKAALIIEDSISHRLGSHTHILKSSGKVATYSPLSSNLKWYGSYLFKETFSTAISAVATSLCLRIGSLRSVPWVALTDEEVEKMYAGESFPDTKGLLGEEVIRKCWNEEFEMAEDVERS